MDERVITFRPKTANCTEYTEDDKSATLTLGYHYGDGGDAALIIEMGDNQPAVCYALEGNGARPSHMGDGFSQDGVMYTLNTIEKHSVCYAIEGNVVDRVSAKNGKGWCEDVSPTLNTQDKHAVCYQNTGQGYWQSHDVAETLRVAPASQYENLCCYDARGNGDGGVAPTITGDHQNRVTDYTAIAVLGNSNSKRIDE
jgi:hypothetical protein